MTKKYIILGVVSFLAFIVLSIGGCAAAYIVRAEKEEPIHQLESSDEQSTTLERDATIVLNSEWSRMVISSIRKTMVGEILTPNVQYQIRFNGDDSTIQDRPARGGIAPALVLPERVDYTQWRIAPIYENQERVKAEFLVRYY